jgi:fructoselysine-6-phosphate deglycase
MIKFDENELLERGSLVYGLKDEIEKIADEISEEGYDNIFFTASGGSVALMQPFEYLIETQSKIPVYMKLSAELLKTGHKQLNERSIAILFSKSGDTPETIEAVKYLNERGVRTIGIVGEPNTPLAQLAKYPIVYFDGRPQEMMLYILVARLLKNNDEFPDYDQFISELKLLPNALNQVRKQADEKALAYAVKYQNDPYQIWVGSGNMWGITYSYSMCVLEESQWLRTKSVSSAEFFHGTLELVEKDVCVTLLKTEGETRPLDDRVEQFASKYTDNFNVFDTKDYELPGISEKFRAYFAPPVMWAVLGRVSVHLEKLRNHPLETRRYYRVVQY